ncbi:MAG: tRNA dihydrouridine synthase DusB [Gammaproteobacteria bacterium]
MRIGPYPLPNQTVLAPMAGVTDRPFRQLCRELGAGLAVSEMMTADARLWGSTKTRRRADHDGESAPVAVQLAGADPASLAEAARRNVDHGAQIIDLNMGCPAKKVCNAWCGSALLQDEVLVARILEAVVTAVDVPVTLKIRTGWDRTHRNAVRIARIAEQSGVQALAVHGRTRADAFQGMAEYATIRDVKAAVTLPVIVNGDIATPEQARAVLEFTGADAVMIGRAAQGRPWIFREIAHYLRTGERLPAPAPEQIGRWLLRHLHELYSFYGEYTGLRVARRHIAWYARAQAGSGEFRARVNQVDTVGAQLDLVTRHFERWCDAEVRAA